MKRILLILFLSPFATSAQELLLKNDRIARKFVYDGKAWLTTAFIDLNSKDALHVRSKEIHILPMDREKGFDISNFRVESSPVLNTAGDSTFLTIMYKADHPEKDLPYRMEIKYYLVKGESFCRKHIRLWYKEPATIDRLEPERFITVSKATGGGRGEPIFIKDSWFFGLEYPGAYSRHTNGNMPASYSRHYDSVGNYSYIDLEGKDIEPISESGMVRLMHFPGYANSTVNGKYEIQSKSAVAGSKNKAVSIHSAFMHYLTTIWKAPRSFLHYNNWFEPRAKDLSGDGLISIYKEIRNSIQPYGINLDAMVADDGWQNRKSIWEPLPKFFPNGLDDIKKLSEQLQKEGTNFGLWLSLNGYTNDIDWGKAAGYEEAVLNKYFKRYRRNYTLSGHAYKQALIQQMHRLTTAGKLVYYKHDFNVLCDLSSVNHPPTDRHGHEATLNAAIEILQASRQTNPAILQNMTNWIWFSPWWLMHADYLWMLAGDDGTNKNSPEISTRATASTDRDTYIWRMWGNAADRPLVPISRLMTHGIIKTTTGRLETKEDNLQDWQDYVLMHYGRGTLLKEWYISPEVMDKDHWKVLCQTDRWVAKHREAFNNTVFVGGRPDEGNPYGYIGWNGDKGVLVARNTSPHEKKMEINFDHTIQFHGKNGDSYCADVVYPYQAAYKGSFTSGKKIIISLPGYATMAFEFRKGKNSNNNSLLTALKFKRTDNVVQLYVPADIKGRCDLMVIGYPELPEVTINGVGTVSYRKNKGVLNKFASYAAAGMASKNVRPWEMSSIDLLPFAGKNISISFNKKQGFEAFIMAERKVKTSKAKEGNNYLWALTHGTRRQTVKIF